MVTVSLYSIVLTFTTLLLTNTITVFTTTTDAVEIQKRRASEEVLHIQLPHVPTDYRRSPSLPICLTGTKPPSVPSAMVIGAPVTDYFDPRMAVVTPDEMRGLGVHKDQFSVPSSEAQRPHKITRRCSDGDLMKSGIQTHRRFSRSLDNTSPLVMCTCPICGRKSFGVSALQAHLDIHK